MDDRYETIPIRPDEITPEHVYINRRRFLKMVGLIGGGALLAACTDAGKPNPTATARATSPLPTGTTDPTSTALPTSASPADELGNALTAFDDATNFNNYYEFSLDKFAVAPLSKNFKTDPWQIEIGGLVENPITLDMKAVIAEYPQEERIYRMRCVEGWSMVIPWLGFPLARLIDLARPTSQAQFIGFQTVNLPDEMPGMGDKRFPWPYTEGLRLDEAMHNLTILATGMYGKPMPPQNGAPIRLVVPWKYGFKSIKSIVKIDLLAEQPNTFWNSIAPEEYGFYSNVNPNKPHPRWSQATERRIGESGKRSTLMFNGYAGEVAYMYEGMNLNRDF